MQRFDDYHKIIFHEFWILIWVGGWKIIRVIGMFISEIRWIQGHFDVDQREAWAAKKSIGFRVYSRWWRFDSMGTHSMLPRGSPASPSVPAAEWMTAPSMSNGRFCMCTGRSSICRWAADDLWMVRFSGLRCLRRRPFRFSTSRPLSTVGPLDTAHGWRKNGTKWNFCLRSRCGSTRNSVKIGGVQWSGGFFLEFFGAFRHSQRILLGG